MSYTRREAEEMAGIPVSVYEEAAQLKAERDKLVGGLETIIDETRAEWEDSGLTLDDMQRGEQIADRLQALLNECRRGTDG